MDGGCRKGFTLVEVLVSVGIVAVILAIVLPALASAREQGRRVKCLVTMRGLHLESTSWQGPNDGKLPSAWDYPQLVYSNDLANIPESGSSVIGFSFTDQVRFWQGPFIANGWDLSADINKLACPSALRRIGRGDCIARGSYWYSIALFTSANLWSSEDDLVMIPNEKRQSVRLEDITFPSAKAMFFESESWHDSAKPIWLGGPGRANVVFVDGSARATDFQNAVTGRRYEGDDRLIPGGGVVPFNSTPFGSAGVDVR
jgi:prepilin-type N-terminal cleavage/methylation domain-containing protein/prepilin-type processing-associated H-X9-DG protein